MPNKNTRYADKGSGECIRDVMWVKIDVWSRNKGTRGGVERNQ